ncbi:hypothetical protein O3Q51_16175 [Cryomorphaceae bacterium 1068]|nr:hypothetical protein [Cryomorphaceae bacterium 1068]
MSRFKELQNERFDYLRTSEDYIVGIYKDSNSIYLGFGDSESVSIPFRRLAELFRAYEYTLSFSQDEISELGLPELP